MCTTISEKPAAYTFMLNDMPARLHCITSQVTVIFDLKTPAYDRNTTSMDNATMKPFYN
jgi:hypothetical protein